MTGRLILAAGVFMYAGVCSVGLHFVWPETSMEQIRFIGNAVYCAAGFAAAAGFAGSFLWSVLSQRNSGQGTKAAA